MKKVLLVNTFYKEFGGENSNFFEEVNFYKKFYNVEILEFDNSKKFNFFDIISLLFNTNFLSNYKLKQIIKKFNPDIVYFHNLWFKGNLGLLKIVERKNLKTLIKIHNYRFICAESYFSKKHLEDNKFCKKCSYSRNHNLKFFNKYYSDSYFKSLALIKHSRKFIKLLKNKKFKILCLTQFNLNYLNNKGISSNKLYKLPNPIYLTEKITYNPENNFYVYAGKVEPSKGIIELIDSWNNVNLKNNTLLIIGDGNQKKELKKFYNLKNVKFLDYLTNEEVLNIIKKSKVVITATKMFEGQPKLLMEAASLGVPSIFPNFGGMKEFFPEDYLLAFEQYNYTSLEDKISLTVDNQLLVGESKKILEHFTTKYSSKKIIDQFENIINA